MKKNKNIKITALASSAAMIAAFGSTTVNAENLFDYEDLGTGSQLRSDLLTADAISSFTSNTDVEFECGEGKCGEGKCGEGKCGEKDGKAKSKDAKAGKAEAKPAKAGKATKAKAAPAPAKNSMSAEPAKSTKSEKAPKN